MRAINVNMEFAIRDAPENVLFKLTDTYFSNERHRMEGKNVNEKI